MKNKAAALALGLVATVGIALAALLPTSATAANQYTQTTTTATATTTTATVTTPGTVTTVTATSTTATAATIPPTPVPTPIGVPTVVSADAVGTVLSAGVVVVSNQNGNVVVDFHGAMVSVPSGSTVTFASDGSLFVGNTGAGTASFYGAPASVSSADRKAHRKALVSHGKITQVYFSTNTNNVVLKSYSIKTGLTKYIKVAGESYAVSKVSKPGHGRVWLNLSAPESTVKTSISSANFKFLGTTLQKLKTEKVKNLRTVYKLVAADGHVYGFVLPLKL